jgi:hypothetical protein
MPMTEEFQTDRVAESLMFMHVRGADFFGNSHFTGKARIAALARFNERAVRSSRAIGFDYNTLLPKCKETSTNSRKLYYGESSRRSLTGLSRDEMVLTLHNSHRHKNDHNQLLNYFLMLTSRHK